MNQKLSKYINSLKRVSSQISNERKEQLQAISGFVKTKLKTEDGAKLNFICTHNSRRSHLCQVWTTTLVHHFGLKEIHTFSGGTEATAFNPRAAAALQRAGFEIENPDGENPRYRVYYDENTEPLICFSKKIEDAANPKENFAAVMTCSDADQNCPVVPGASARFSIPYTDPKEADGTPKEEEIYDERCQQIAAEMYFMLSQL